jgi:hypothetical protein
MRSLAYLLIALGAGCTTDGDEFPVISQGGPEAPSRPGTAPRTITSRICVIGDLQVLSSCTVGAGGGLTVELGDVVTTTQADGSFTVTVPPVFTNTANPTFFVTGPGIVPSAFPFTIPFANVAGVPVISADVFARALSSNGVPLGLTTGTILGTVRDVFGPLANITVRATPASVFGPFFDAATSTNWGVDGTGMRGVVLIPGLTAGMVDLSFSHIAGGLETQVAGVTVRNGGVTILDTELIRAPTP